MWRILAHVGVIILVLALDKNQRTHRSAQRSNLLHKTSPRLVATARMLNFVTFYFSELVLLARILNLTAF